MASSLLLTWVLVLALVQTALGDSHKYNYDISDTKYGPLGWAKTFPKYCAGSSQSPIDIVTSKAKYDASLGNFTLSKFDSVPTGAQFKVNNNGHTYTVLFTPDTFLVSGGGLTDTYTTLQLHLHWGSDNTKGSEHTVDGTEFPAELHFVNYNQKYGNLGEAVKHSDGLAVLGVIFKVGATENPALASFLKYAANVTEPSEAANLPMTHTLASLLPPSTTDFYRYSGGLTTPTCNEVVTWTVFKNYAPISAKELNMLRGLKENNVTALTNTFRPPQPLNSRVVKRSFKTADKKPTPPASGAHHVIYTITTFVSVAMAIFLSIM